MSIYKVKYNPTISKVTEKFIKDLVVPSLWSAESRQYNLDYTITVMNEHNWEKEREYDYDYLVSLLNDEDVQFIEF